MQPRRKAAIWSNDTEVAAPSRGHPGGQQQVHSLMTSLLTADATTCKPGMLADSGTLRIL